MSVVYVIVADQVGMVKIGLTDHLWTRLGQMQTHCPVPLRAAVCLVGGTALEAELHRRFTADRTHGEWFRLSPEVQAFLDQHEPPVKIDGRLRENRNRKHEIGLSLSTRYSALRAVEEARRRMHTPAPVRCVGGVR